MSWFEGQLLLCLKPFVVFLQLSPGLNLWYRFFFREVFVEKSGTVGFNSFSDWASSETRLIHSITCWILVLVCHPIPVAARVFLTINVSSLYWPSRNWLMLLFCFNVFIEVFFRYFFDMRVRTGNTIVHYYSISHFCPSAIIFIKCVWGNDQGISNSLPDNKLPWFI